MFLLPELSLLLPPSSPADVFFSAAGYPLIKKKAALLVAVFCGHPIMSPGESAPWLCKRRHTAGDNTAEEDHHGKRAAFFLLAGNQRCGRTQQMAAAGETALGEYSSGRRWRRERQRLEKMAQGRRQLGAILQ